MPGRKKSSEKDKAVHDLRAAAEKKVTGSGKSSRVTETPDIEKLVHELRVHQAELEMQNEELRNAQLALEESRERVQDLYDFSPAGYFTLTRDAVIAEANLTGADLLGVPRKNLLQQRFRQFITPGSLDAWDRHFTAASGRKEKLACELELKRADGAAFHARLDSIMTMAGGAPVVRIAITDITERVRIDEEKHAILEKYRELFENMHSGVAVYEVRDDGRDFIFKDFNRAAERIDNDSRDRLVGKSVFEVRPGIEKFGLIEVFREVWRTGRPAHLPERFYQDERKTGWYENFVYRLPSGEIVAIFDDITERKRAEETLRASKDSLNESQKIANMGSWQQDLIDQTAKWSENCFTIYGYTPFEFEPSFKDFKHRVHPDDWHIIEEHFDLVLKDKTPSSSEMRIILPDGTQKWFQNNVIPVLQDDKVIALKGVNIDITERKRAETALRDSEKELQAINTRLQEMITNQDRSRRVLLGIVEDEQLSRKVLRESEERYRVLVENINDVIYSLDASGVITYVSPVIERISRYRADELVGTRFDRLVHPEDLPGLIEEFAETIEGNINEYEYRLLDKDGTIHYVRTSSRTISKDGIVTGLTAIMTDITERKLAEIRLRELYTDLERKVAERTADLEKANRELESFSYTVSHDLRAPLRHINGFFEMFRREMGDMPNEKARHYMEVISDSVKRMGQLIDDLLTFSRMGRADLAVKPVDMESLAGNVVKDLSDEIKARSISVSRNPLPAAKGDMAMLRVVLVNLLSNAVKFTSKNEHPAIEIGCETKNGENVYFVKDNGAGFDMKYADKLFGVFHRLHSDKEFEGTGIGLATVKSIIQRHGGRIWAEGEVGKGACFYFTLPAADGPQGHGETEG